MNDCINDLKCAELLRGVLIDRFEIVAHDSPRPQTEQIIFCDGTGGSLYQTETDLELSHWRPNKTPAEFRAGTSTEICFRFLDNPWPGNWAVAVNNHVDVDGILSVYVLLHSQQALANRQTIMDAAEIGDFWGWGEKPAQRVFQGITRLMHSGEGAAVYAEAFRRIPGLIDGTALDVPEIDESLAPLRRDVELVEQDRIIRSLIGNYLAHYIVPLGVAGDNDERASYVPGFNEAISEKSVFWPQVRARWDAQRVCLVSIERTSGWFHDLWCPGYLWADTGGLWRVPGLLYHAGMSSYDLSNPKLIAAFEALQRKESAPGCWALGGTQMRFGAELQERFPLVGRFLDELGQAAASQLTPEHVAKECETVFG